jgi:hypothetical protein
MEITQVTFRDTKKTNWQTNWQSYKDDLTVNPETVL